jgi:hypothetical protein
MRSSFIGLVAASFVIVGSVGCAKSDAGNDLGSTAEAVTTNVKAFPTGVDQNGAALDAGSEAGLVDGGAIDPHYVIAATTDPVFDAHAPLPAYVVATIEKPGAWVANSATAQWISPLADDCGSTCGSDTYDYATLFTVPAGGDGGTTQITGTISADDDVAIYVNGKQTNVSFTNAYSTITPFTITSASVSSGSPINFVNPDGGMSELVFRVTNSGSGPTGLYVHTLAISLQTQCNVDTDCNVLTDYCNAQINACVPRLGNGVGTTSDPIHSAGCPIVGPAECTSLLCEASDGECGLVNSDTCTIPTQCRSNVCAADLKCGYADGTGVCTTMNASACRSGVCSPKSLKCGACNADNDCDTTAQFCNGTTFTCETKLDNGTTISADPLHGGTCNVANAAAVCKTGACDGTTCGVKLGDGTCTTTAQCSSGGCITTTGAANFGKCEACATSVQCTTATSPICNATSDTCVACNGDNGTTATNACPSTSDPFCASDGSCGKCTASTQCASGTRTGTICNATSGACTSLCTIDADCGAEWCNNPTAAAGAGMCAAKIPNGQLVPSAAPINGMCSSAVATRVCVSTVCDGSDNECGFANNDGTCTTQNATTVCRSGACDADGKCGLANGDGTCTMGAQCRSTICGSSGICAACANDTQCATGSMCNGGVCVVAVDAGVTSVVDAGSVDASVVDATVNTMSDASQPSQVDATLANAPPSTIGTLEGGGCSASGRRSSSSALVLLGIALVASRRRRASRS